MDSYLIREVEESELSVCAKVVRDSFMTVANEFGLTKKNCPTNGAFITAGQMASKRGEGALMFGLFIKGSMAGYAELEFEDDGTAELGKLAVLSEYRHKGYGQALIKHAAQKAREANKTKMAIGIIDENTILKNWYLRCGFVEREKKKFSSLPFTVCFMEMNLG